jgi:hypothetical protein
MPRFREALARPLIFGGAGVSGLSAAGVALSVALQAGQFGTEFESGWPHRGHCITFSLFNEAACVRRIASILPYLLHFYHPAKKLPSLFYSSQ